MFLRAISYELGRPTELDVLSTGLAPEKVRQIDSLVSGGFRSFRIAEEPCWRLAATAAAGSLAKAGLRPNEIDLVLFASSSFLHHDHPRGDMDRLCSDLGLKDALSIGVTGAECANVALALDVARQYLATGRARTILLVTSDKAPQWDRRILDPPIALLSDGAAACILDSWSGLGFGVDTGPVVFDHEARFLNDPKEFPLLVKRTCVGVRKAARGLLDGSRPRVARLVMSNLVEPFTALICAQLDIPRAAVFDQNIARNGHVFAADVLVNLADAIAKEPEAFPANADDQRWMMFASGTASWGGCLLRKLSD
jgi:3-oxoacyl-[acyl-carrier-protein] synthase III